MSGVYAIVGSREFDDEAIIHRTIDRLMIKHYDGLTLISGHARGADRIAEDYARRRHFHFCMEDEDTITHLPLPYHFCAFPVTDEQWRTVGKTAGHKRNAKIVQHIGELIAFYAPGPRTAGTTDVLNKAIKAGLPWHFYHEGRWESGGPSSPSPRARRVVSREAGALHVGRSGARYRTRQREMVHVSSVMARVVRRP